MVLANLMEPFFYKSANLAQNLKRRSMVSIETKSISYKAPGKFEEGRHEKIHNVVFEDSSTASIAIANEALSGVSPFFGTMKKYKTPLGYLKGFFLVYR